MPGPVYLGIDVGAYAAKSVVVKDDLSVLGRGMATSGIDFASAGEEAIHQALSRSKKKMSDVRVSTATGYGRKNVFGVTLTKTELTCHGKGAFIYFPEPVTVIDIGGQDNKIIHMDNQGRLGRFKMNRKCAAGTGAFLEEIARRIDIDLAKMGEMAEKSTESIEIGSFCTVFSMTEILSLARKGKKTPDIIKAAYRSMVKRIMEMDDLTGKIVMTGGVVAHNPIIATLLKEELHRNVHISPHPQYIGAMGAAACAIEEANK